MSPRNFIFFLLFIPFFISCSQKDGEDTPTQTFAQLAAKNTSQELTQILIGNNCTKLSDISYGSDSRNVMDIYIPHTILATGKTVIFIHGGGWILGDKSLYNEFIPYYTSAGITCVSINYRYANSSKKVTYKELIEDIDLAIQFLKKNHTKYNSKFNDITLIGQSAGAHLALLYAYTHDNIKNTVSMSGFTDFTDPELYRINGMDSLVLNLIGGKLNNDLLKDVSPIYHYNKTTTYLYHGTEDNIVPISQAYKLFEKINPLNSNDKIYVFNDCGHSFSDIDNQIVIQQTIQLINLNSTYSIPIFDLIPRLINPGIF